MPKQHTNGHSGETGRAAIEHDKTETGGEDVATKRVVSTGLPKLDENLGDGGIPLGSFIVFERPPSSAAELLPWTVIARGCHPEQQKSQVRQSADVVTPDTAFYISTGERPEKVSERISELAPTDSVPTGLRLSVERIDPFDPQFTDDGGGNQLELTEKLDVMSNIDDHTPVIVVDSLTSLFRLDAEVWKPFVESLHTLARENRAIVIAGLDSSTDKTASDRYIHQISDGVFQYHAGDKATDYTDRIVVPHLRSAPGYRDGFPFSIDLDIEDEIAVEMTQSL